MKFFYHGVKKSNEPGIASGCVLLIGFGALIYFFTLLDGIEDLTDHLFEIILVSMMGISMLFMLFSKKAKLTNRHVRIQHHYFKLEEVVVPLEEMIMDVYTLNGEFHRYHVRDSKGKITLYSIYKDDLLLHFQEQLSSQIRQFEELSSNHDGPYISVKAESRTLSYNLESGKYTISPNNEAEISFLPEIFAYDGKYKKGTPLLKKKSKS